jgi:hypothetical protein
MADHPMTPPPELVQQWASEWMQLQSPNRDLFMATRAAQYGADQELEACCEWITSELRGQLRPANRIVDQLRAARRPSPKPPETIEVDGFTYRLVR